MGALVMPRLGETVTEGTVVRWLKREGEKVERDEMIVEISTDKVDTEIPSPDSGIVQRILIEQGGKVEVGTRLAVIGDGAKTEKIEAAPAQARPEPEPEPSVSATLSPIVRKLARENKVDLSKIKGTGRGGRITKKDVLKEIESVAPPPIFAPAEGPRPYGREEVVPLSNMRKMIAEHMSRSIRTSAHVTVVFEVDMENIVRSRQVHKEKFKEREGFSLTYLPFVCRAVIEALGQWPTLNSVLDGDNLILKKYINLGIAVAIDEGLIVPVIKGAEGLNILGLARAIHDLAERARSGHLLPDEVHDGTFTITNPGSFGTLVQTPIINQPQVGIVSFEGIVKRPVAVDSAIALRHMVNLGLSYDHRVNDGAVAAQFMVDVKSRLEAADFGDESLVGT